MQKAPFLPIPGPDLATRSTSMDRFLSNKLNLDLEMALVAPGQACHPPALPDFELNWI